MNKIESFNIEEPKNIKIEENDDLDIRYKVTNPDLKSPLILDQNNNNKKKKKWPILVYVLFFALFILISLIITLIIEKLTKNANYNIDENPYLKPNISNHTYTNIKFDNNLELLLIQVDENDTAGGAIIFDTGYFDTNYEPGFLKLAILSLITDEIQNSEKLRDFLGNFDYSIGEHYSYFSFKILNDGFFNYLEIFAKLTYLKENDERFDLTFIKNKIKVLNSALKSENKNLKKRENHLLEYLIYGYKNKNGSDIFPDGNQITYDNIRDEDINNIINIMKSLLNPSKIKIVLNSHFKMSLMRNKFLRYFKNIANIAKTDNQNNNERNAYSLSDFTTKKMIYMQIESYQTNYIKINYYINQKDNNYTKLNINKGYLNYLKYILDEMNPNSLYYNLTHSDNFNIKSLSCDFEIVLKNRIKFSINIDLNSYSYAQLQDIISIVYQYMNDLVKYINSLDSTDKRKNELYRIVEQNFSFTEDMHDITPYNPQRGINLFCKNQDIYFLRDIWLPRDFDFSELKEYISQLTPDNSVLIIAINNRIFEKYFKDSKLSYIFNNPSNIQYYDINYTIKNLDESFLNITDDNNFKNFTFIKNKYVSTYTGSSILEYNKEDENNYLNSDSETIGYKNSSIFYFKRDTSFRIPKVYIKLTFFHPFMRPNNIDDKFNHQRFFEVMLYMAYIKREINLNLADAIRAGNIFIMNFNQNLFYIDVFAFSDIAKMILDKIKEIIYNTNNFKWDEEILFEIYRDAALEDYLNFETTSQNMKIRMIFYENLFDVNKKQKGIYNYYKFPRDDYLNVNNSIMNYTLMLHITKFIINGHIYGYYTYEEAENIYKLFPNFDEGGKNFNLSLYYVNLTTLDLNSNNFVEWMIAKNNLINNKTEHINNCGKDIKLYRFLHWSTYDIPNRVISFIFNQILNEALQDKTNKEYESLVFSQGEIYLQFNIKNGLFNDHVSFRENVNQIFIEKKDDYSKNINFVGDRLYYLIRSYIMDLISKREDLKSSAISRANSNSLKADDYTTLNEIKNLNYNNFSLSFNNTYEKQFLIDFKCN